MGQKGNESMLDRVLLEVSLCRVEGGDHFRELPLR